MRRRSLLTAWLPLPGIAQALSAPADTGFRIPGGFEPAAAVWLGYDRGHAPWTVALAGALAPHVPLRLLVRDETAAQEARATLYDHGIETQDLRVHIDPHAAFFMQDAAVFAVDADGGLGVVDFKWSGHGLAAWCERRYAGAPEHTDACARTLDAERGTLSRTVAAFAGAQVIDTPLHLEGGGVEVNGRGTMIANEAQLRSRNPASSRAEIERELLRLPGLRKVIWLPEGLAEDPHLRATIVGPYVGWGTGGHTDQFVRFADARTVLLAWAGRQQAAAHPVARLTRERMQRNLGVLSRATDADGRPLRVVKVPLPAPVQRTLVLAAQTEATYSERWPADTFRPDEDGRDPGDKVIQVAPASYLNFVAVNGVVLVPDYVSSGTPPALQQRVRALFQHVFPQRRIVFVDSVAANWYAGGPHCAVLQQPAGGR